MNPWHDVSFGKNAPDVVNALIEIPKGTRAKYEICKETGLLKLDRVIYSSMYYPTNYGFIPQTLCGDGDPLDILVLSQIAFEPRCLVECRPIGVMRMKDKGQDDKIIAVAVKDISVAHLFDVEQLPESMLLEITNFFEEYKKLENQLVKVEPIQNHLAAKQIILDNIDFYRTSFSKL